MVDDQYKLAKTLYSKGRYRAAALALNVVPKYACSGGCGCGGNCGDSCGCKNDHDYMSRQSIEAIADAAEELYDLVNQEQELDDWVEFKITRSKTDLYDVLEYLRYHSDDDDWVEIEPAEISQHPMITTASKYKGKEVTLGKPTKGDRKKYKVYVKNDKGNVVKVEFGDPNMSIKRDDPKRRKSFRARHNCKNPGPRWKARYWSCRMWSKKPVSKILSKKK